LFLSFSLLAEISLSGPIPPPPLKSVAPGDIFCFVPLGARIVCIHPFPGRVLFPFPLVPQGFRSHPTILFLDFVYFFRNHRALFSSPLRTVVYLPPHTFFSA